MEQGNGFAEYIQSVFRQFDFSDNDFYMQNLNKQWFEKVTIDKHTIDIDSSIITRFGSQEGVEIGYNPKRHGRDSHHHLIAFSATEAAFR